MNYHNLNLTLLFLFFLVSIKSLSQERFEHLGIKDGLSNNSIKNIIQTDDGYLWFGTLNGLNRYDGKEIRSFVNNPCIPWSLTSNRINNIFEDSLNYIWVLTYDFKVFRFNPQTEKFININRYLPSGKFIGGSRVDIFSSSPNIVWIASDEGELFRIRQEKDSERLQFDFFDPANSPETKFSTFFYKDSDERLWIGTDRGLLLLKNDSVDLGNLSTDDINFIDTNYRFESGIEIRKDYLVFGTTAHGLFTFKDGYFSRWNPLPDHHLNVNYILPGKKNDFIITTKNGCIYYINSRFEISKHEIPGIQSFHKAYCDRLGMFWVLPNKRGITQFDPLQKVFKYYDLNSNMRESFGDPDKPMYLEDKKGNVWIGIYGGGLFKFNRVKQKFILYQHQNKNTNSLSSNFILSIYEDNSENLWVGTFKNGLNKLNLSESSFQYKELVPNATYESQNEVRSFIEDNKQRIWVGTKYGDIYCCDQDNNILFKIPDNLSNKSKYVRSNVYALLTDGDDLWVGTKGNGLYRIYGILDFEKNNNRNFKIEVFKNNSNNPNSLPYDDVFSLHQDHFGQIWVGTYHGGLSVIRDPSLPISFSNYGAASFDTTTISDNRVRKIYRDRDNNIWVGTVHGLNYIDSRYVNSENVIFHRFYAVPGNENSLSNNDIFDIHQDLEGNIWVATYGGGLNRIIFRDNITEFKHISRNDGLPSDIVFSILEDDNLNLWVGTDNGIGKFSTKRGNVELIEDDNEVGHSVFTEGCKLKSFNGEFLFGTLNGFIRFIPDSINNKKKDFPIVLTGFKLFNEIILPNTEGSPLKASINNTDKIKLNHNQNFIELNFAVLDFSAPDKIQYSYKLENFENQWNKTVNTARAIYRGIPPGEYVFKLRATDSKGVWMDKARELIIVIKPPIWETFWAYLVYLFTIAVILYFIIKEIRFKNNIKYENKLSEEKLKFFTNISHEFKTPLTLISNSIDDISKSNQNKIDAHSSINLIKKNVEDLHVLIEQLIDFRRLQKGVLELQVTKIEVISYLKDIYITFLPYAEKKKLQFTFDSNVEKFEGWLDRRFIDKIIYNLLSNAFKFTPANKKVWFKVEISEHNLLKIQIQDQGEGIRQENISKIFERFVHGDSSAGSYIKGSGIGLSLVNEMVQSHKGTIDLRSKYEEGSTFYVTLPVGEDSYLNNEKNSTSEIILSHQKKPFHVYSEEKKKKATVQHNNTSKATKYKLLIIDDNHELREYLFGRLEKEYQVYTTVDGEEGIKLAEEVNPDLIITDLKMPKINGIELIKHLKDKFETSHIPIILLSAESSLDSKIEGLNSGADDYITKPFSLDYLNHRVFNIISQRKILKEKFSKGSDFKPERLSISKNDQKFLTRVIELIELNIKKPNFNIEDMIGELGVSRTVFFKKMKSISGYAPKEFVRVVKMKRSAKLLQDPEISISEVSFSVGFSDPDYFGKSFKTFFGETPSSYQKKYS